MAFSGPAVQAGAASQFARQAGAAAVLPAVPIVHPTLQEAGVFDDLHAMAQSFQAPAGAVSNTARQVVRLGQTAVNISVPVEDMGAHNFDWARVNKLMILQPDGMSRVCSLCGSFQGRTLKMEAGGQNIVNRNKILRHLQGPGHRLKVDEQKGQMAAALLTHPIGANTPPAVLSQTPTVISGTRCTVHSHGVAHRIDVASAAAPSVAVTSLVPSADSASAALQGDTLRPATAIPGSVLPATALPSAVPRRNRWGPSVPVAGSASASALQDAPPAAAASVANLHARAHHSAVPPMGVGGAYPSALPPMGGGGRPQQACERVGCHNHKVLDCSYGLCMPCCAAEKRTPRCQVNRHYNKNTHY